MIILIYSEINEQSIESRLGDPDYSYYFVLKEFRPILESLGQVVLVRNPREEADPIFREAAARNEPCVLFSFSPPHRTLLGLDCPTIPVLAWEFDTIPSETWYCERDQDWRFVLSTLGRAITHSLYSARVIQKELGADFPVVSIPAPVWDRFAEQYREPSGSALPVATTVSVAGSVVDTRHDRGGLLRARRSRSVDIALDGVVYLSIFSPYDGRKNAPDMIEAFCHAFNDVEDATLILKLSHRQADDALPSLLGFIEQLKPFRCRVLLVTGYLETEMYRKLIEAATYAINASHGEGQCLPVMELMACGKPAVAPRHSAMSDYIDEDNAFVVNSSAEPTCWPQDPRFAFRTLRQRIDFESLTCAYRESYCVAKNDPNRYALMARSAHEAMRRHSSRALATEQLAKVLSQPLPVRKIGSDYGRVKRPDAPWLADVTAGTRVLEYGDGVRPVTFALASLGAKVDAVGPTQRFCRTAVAESRIRAIDVSPHLGAFGSNPEGIPHAYDLILFHGCAERLEKLDSVLPALRNMLVPHGAILVAVESIRARENLWSALFANDGEFGTVAPTNDLLDEGFPEDAWILAFKRNGFTWRRFNSKFTGRRVTIYEFRVWNDPLRLADCYLTEAEESSWHGREAHGRWTKADTFIDLPSRDGVIAIAARNSRPTKCIGKMVLGARAAGFELETGQSVVVRLPQMNGRIERLSISSDLCVGGPNDPRELGVCIESVAPI